MSLSYSESNEEHPVTANCKCCPLILLSLENKTQLLRQPFFCFTLINKGILLPHEKRAIIPRDQHLMSSCPGVCYRGAGLTSQFFFRILEVTSSCQNDLMGIYILSLLYANATTGKAWPFLIQPNETSKFIWISLINIKISFLPNFFAEKWLPALKVFFFFFQIWQYVNIAVWECANIAVWHYSIISLWQYTNIEAWYYGNIAFSIT